MGKLKKKTKIAICVLTVVFLFIAALSLVCLSRMSFFYSEKQHLARIRSLAVERYLGEDRIYTDLDVYPIYNEEDKLEYALIELKPKGFLYVHINDNAIFSLLGARGMYIRSTGYDDQIEGWTPYHIVDGKKEIICDENGTPIEYMESHFKAMGIENERRYMLLAYCDGSYELIPAVKRGEQYLDLVDGAFIDYDSSVHSTSDGQILYPDKAHLADSWAYANLFFGDKAEFNL